MKQPTINLRNLRKPSQIYRKAAEMLQYTVETKDHDLNIDGCCSAFDTIESIAWDKIHKVPQFSYRYYATREKVLDLRDKIEEAREDFARIYKPVPSKLYWFGTNFNREEQEHRITALLMMADMAESEGK